MEKLEVRAPYNQELISELYLHGEQEIEFALTKANELFLSREKWLPAHQRKSILNTFAQLLERDQDKLIEIAANEGGKPYVDTEVEVLRAINGVHLAMEHMSQMKGEEIPMGLTTSSENRMAYTFLEPKGVVLSISAFNHPINLIIHQVIPAIAVGAPVIIKPALTTPLSCIKLVELLKEAGLPEGWVKLIICSNENTSRMVKDERVSFMSFIGSSKVGWMLRSQLSPGATCALEHGGAAPVIIDEGVDFSEILPAVTRGAFYHAGQVCVSVQRIYVNEKDAEVFAGQLADFASQLEVGNPHSQKTEVGPLISPKEVDRVEQWVNESGGKILCGGKRISDTCYSPTVILDPKEDALVSTQEIFGPVVCVYSAESLEQAIERANQLPFDFQAAIFTKNIDNAIYATRRLKANTVLVNDQTAFRVDWMPFGGSGHSGLGKGGIQYSMMDMTKEKLFVFKSSMI